MQTLENFEKEAADTVLNENRHWQRRRVLKAANIAFNKGYSRYSCVAKNLCGQGAMIELGETTGIPSHFEFHLDGYAPIQSEVIWRSPQRLGIKFVGV